MTSIAGRSKKSPSRKPKLVTKKKKEQHVKANKSSTENDMSTDCIDDQRDDNHNGIENLVDKDSSKHVNDKKKEEGEEVRDDDDDDETVNEEADDDDELHEDNEDEKQNNYIDVHNSDDSEGDSSDEGMMETFALSNIKSKTITEARNDEAGLERKLLEISLLTGKGTKQRPILPFHQSLCVNLEIDQPLSDNLAVKDLEREKRIAELTTIAVHKGLDKLRSEKIKFRRPNDYLAQMIKTDEQMKKIKKKILKENEKINNAQTRRNNRDIQKNKKKLRQQQLQKEQEKKQKANQEIKNISHLRQQRLKQRALNSNNGDNDNDNENNNNNNNGDDDEFPIDMLDIEQLDDQSKFQKQKDIVSGKNQPWKSSSSSSFINSRNKRDSGRKYDRDNDDDDNDFKSNRFKRGRHGHGGKDQKKFKPDGSIKKYSGGKKKRLGKSRRLAQKSKN